MPKKKKNGGKQKDGSLVFTIILPADVAGRFIEAMNADDRESKSEFARLLIKRQLNQGVK